MQRCYSTFEVRSINEAEMIIEGIASTPSPDRLGDIVEPLGAQFKLPLPLLWQHNAGKPVGSVIRAKPQKDGIPVTVKLANIAEPGALRERITEAWQSVKAGLVRGFSIGFNPIEKAQIENTWSYRFSVWEWLELSLVTIPANVEATITQVRSIDAGLLAASGKESSRVVRLDPQIIRRVGLNSDGIVRLNRVARDENQRTD